MRRSTSLLICSAIVFGLGAGVGCSKRSGRNVAVDWPTEDRSLGKLTYLGGLRLGKLEAERIGGLSSLWVDESGTRFATVSDGGFWLEGTIEWSDDYAPESVSIGGAGPLYDPNGTPLRDKATGDAEALVRLDEGWLVSFEHQHRLLLYPKFTEPAASSPVREPDFSGMPQNGGVEAMERLDADRLLLISEQARADGGGLAAWVSSGSQVEPYRYTGALPLEPTDLAQLPDGRIAILERSYEPGVGNKIRLALLSVDDAARTIQSTELARMARPLPVDNFEGLASFRTPAGDTILLMLSDDNFNASQRTLLLAFRLDE